MRQEDRGLIAGRRRPPPHSLGVGVAALCHPLAHSTTYHHPGTHNARRDAVTTEATTDPAPGAVRIPIPALVLGPNVVAGANPLVVMALAYRYRSTTEDEHPADVTPAGDGFWRIRDGRHRYLASVIAGRPDLLCCPTDPAHDAPTTGGRP